MGALRHRTCSSPEPRLASAAAPTTSDMAAAPATGRTSSRRSPIRRPGSSGSAPRRSRKPGPLQWGTAARNDVVAPGRNNWNVALFKAFQLKEKRPVRVPGGNLQHLQPYAVRRSQHERDRRQLRTDHEHLQPAHLPARGEVPVLIEQNPAPARLPRQAGERAFLFGAALTPASASWKIGTEPMT